MISVSSLDVSNIVKNINFNVKKGEMLAIIGPNGAGKSTILKSLSGSIKIGKGKVSLNNKDIIDIKPIVKAKYLAYLPQFIDLAFEYTVYDIIEMGLYNHPPKGKSINLVISDLLDMVGCGHLILHRYSTLSGGEKQRVHFARVIAQLDLLNNSDKEFKCLLLDEHSSHLDLHHQHESFKLLREFIKQYNLSVIVVIHDINLAVKYSDNVLVIKEGDQLEFGEINKIINPKLIMDVYNVNASYIEEYNQFLIS